MGAQGLVPVADHGQEKVTYLDLMKALLDDGADPERPARQEALVPLLRRSFLGGYGGRDCVLARGAIDRPCGDAAAGRATARIPDIPTFGGDTPLMVASGIGWGYHYSMNAAGFTGWTR